MTAPATYEISASGDAITCRSCGRTSYHPVDVRERYCGHCHHFHDDAARRTEVHDLLNAFSCHENR